MTQTKRISKSSADFNVAFCDFFMVYWIVAYNHNQYVGMSTSVLYKLVNYFAEHSREASADTCDGD